MRRRSHIGGQPPEALHELASDPRIAFGFEFPPAILADRQKNLHELHGVSFGSARDNSTLTTRVLPAENKQPVSQPHVLRTVPMRSKFVLARRCVAAFQPRNNFNLSAFALV